MKLMGHLATNRGSIIPYLLIFFPAVLFIIYQLASVVSIANKEQTRVRTITSITITQANLMAYLKDPTAWSKTIADPVNVNLNCLRTHSNCVVGNEGNFQVDDAVGNVIYNSIPSTSGFDTGGGTCNNYGLILSGSQCPIRVNLSWKADCSLPCTPTRVKIIGDFVVSGQTNQIQLNMKPYYFEFLLNVP
ncbi:MAG: hypothetical protein H7328_10400 [Bdellovibrio sp.]|nr:hypothetical protein [Bdellovibrio sp.]